MCDPGHVLYATCRVKSVHRQRPAGKIYVRASRPEHTLAIHVAIHDDCGVSVF
jgi:hypothetical protein